jgi:2-oxo-4-hydroxy-4-carboxy-5-ureidoimidazoline decarboxylase
MRLPAPRHGARAGAMPLHRFNEADRDDAEAALLACCASPRWAARLAAHRPYPTVDAALAAADEAAYDMTHAELDEALACETADHPPGQGPATLAAHTALRAAHAAYAARFGHAFVVCLDTYRPEERLDQALTALRTRLGHEDDQERRTAAEELRLLARGRLARLLGAGAAPAAGPCRGRPRVPD